MATMDDIANRLGLSKGTVSKALNGAEDVSEATRRTVLETAVELGYSRRRSAEPPKLAVFIKDMEWERPEDFGYEILSGFRKQAEPDGWAVEILPLTRELQDTPYDSFMLRHNYRGAFFLGVTLVDPWSADFSECRTPTVLLDSRSGPNPNVSQVGIDNDEAMEALIERLHQLGHIKIGYLGGGTGSFVFEERFSSFIRILHRSGISPADAPFGRSYFAPVCVGTYLPRLLLQGCTAVICSHDTLARDVMIRCRQLGIRIPEELSVTGIDDLPLCQTLAPPLSSVRQNRDALGRGAYYALGSQIGGTHVSALKLHPEPIYRGSVGPAPEKSCISAAPDEVGFETGGHSFSLRSILPEEIEQAVKIEQICFPPNEACSPRSMQERIAAAPETFLAALDMDTGRLAGFINGIALNESGFRDEFFTDAGLHDPKGKNLFILGLDVLPEYRGIGLGRALAERCAERERLKGRKCLVLTCLEPLVGMYEKFGFTDLGLSASVWGGESWHEMSRIL